MKSQYLPLYAIALAILIVGLAFAGVSVPTILFSLLVLACPLMMMLMMGGGHGGHGEGSDEHARGAGDHRHGPTAGQR
jgi:peptidoglycan/LPS O-acetylase OafA/YrhL